MAMDTAVLRVLALREAVVAAVVAGRMSVAIRPFWIRQLPRRRRSISVSLPLFRDGASEEVDAGHVGPQGP